MNVLVTGASGFVGNYAVNELLKEGHRVIATSRNPDRAKECTWFSKVHYIPCDLDKTQDNFFAFFGKPELLIHLAWNGLPNYDGLFHIEENLPANYRFLKNIIKHGLNKLLVSGTCLEYGLLSGALDEEMVTAPVTPYGLAKDTLRKCLEQLQEKIDFQMKWVRLFYMFGKGQSRHSILAQLDKAVENEYVEFKMSGGEQLRDYLPIEKVAEYLIKIAMQTKVNGIINCCSGIPISIRKLVEDYLEKTERNISLNLGYYPYPDYEPMAFWGINQKMKMALEIR
ncbi:MAG: NAD(P)-dependent oxidoreductase [Thermodesulfobacteriota bacterium]|nr:NAD(P)-dependent oxidoreductase [Thermodesulfobacteriota bacterium]